MRILVTGSSGNIGQEIVRQLPSRHAVTGVDCRPGPSTHVCADLTDRAAVEPLVARADAIVHTAALHVAHVAPHSKEAFVEVNIKSTLYLLEAAVRHGMRRLVYTSSTSAYGHALEARGVAV